MSAKCAQIYENVGPVVTQVIELNAELQNADNPYYTREGDLLVFILNTKKSGQNEPTIKIVSKEICIENSDKNITKLNNRKRKKKKKEKTVASTKKKKRKNNKKKAKDKTIVEDQKKTSVKKLTAKGKKNVKAELRDFLKGQNIMSLWQRDGLARDDRALLNTEVAGIKDKTFFVLCDIPPNSKLKHIKHVLLNGLFWLYYAPSEIADQTWALMAVTDVKPSDSSFKIYLVGLDWSGWREMAALTNTVVICTEKM